MYVPRSFEIVEEPNDYTVILDDGTKLGCNEAIRKYHCAVCLSTLGYKEPYHGVECQRCGAQDLIPNRDWKAYVRWANEYIEGSPDDYLSTILERGLAQRFEDITYRSMHTCCGADNPQRMELPPHLRKGG